MAALTAATTTIVATPIHPRAARMAPPAAGTVRGTPRPRAGETAATMAAETAETGTVVEGTIDDESRVPNGEVPVSRRCRGRDGSAHERAGSDAALESPEHHLHHDGRPRGACDQRLRVEGQQNPAPGSPGA